MLVAKIVDDRIEVVGEHKKLFPNVSFPKTGPDDDWLNQNSVKIVSVYKEYDKATQRLVTVEEPYIEGDFVYAVQVVDLTAQEQSDNANTQNSMMSTEKRNTRNSLLSDTDWTQMTDSPVTNEKKTEWANYRQALRDLPTNSEWPNVEMPNTSVYIT